MADLCEHAALNAWCVAIDLDLLRLTCLHCIGMSCDKVCAVAKEIMPTIFKANLFRKTADKWKKAVQKIEAAEKEA